MIKYQIHEFEIHELNIDIIQLKSEYVSQLESSFTWYSQS